VHRVIEPKILYFGTPVVLLSTRNPDGSANLAPISSAWWLGQSCMLGMSGRSRTVQNLRRERECVINLPSVDLVDAVDRLAMLTGADPVPPYKAAMGYRHEADKFTAARLTPQPSDLVQPPRVAECAVQMEAVIENLHPFGPADSQLTGIEARIVRVHADPAVMVRGHDTHFDPDRWRPLVMSFCEFYGLGERVHPSRLAAAYAPPEPELAVA